MQKMTQGFLAIVTRWYLKQPYALSSDSGYRHASHTNTLHLTLIHGRDVDHNCSKYVYDHAVMQ